MPVAMGIYFVRNYRDLAPRWRGVPPGASLQQLAAVEAHIRRSGIGMIALGPALMIAFVVSYFW
jgi:hypothetical protein